MLNVYLFMLKITFHKPQEIYYKGELLYFECVEVILEFPYALLKNELNELDRVELLNIKSIKEK
jgi:hypothetical protein